MEEIVVNISLIKQFFYSVICNSKITCSVKNGNQYIFQQMKEMNEFLIHLDTDVGTNLSLFLVFYLF